ncbi:MAG: WG repeat-containing protein [Cytophagaceae bacterium]
MTYSTWKNSLKYTATSLHRLFFVSFLLLFTNFFLVQAKLPETPVTHSAYTVLLNAQEYSFFAAPKDSFYTIVIIRDTTSNGSPIRLAALYQKGVVILPAYYDSIYYAGQDHFVVTQHLVERRSYRFGTGLYYAPTQKFIFTCQPSFFQPLNKGLIEINKQHHIYLYSLQTKSIVTSFEGKYKIDSSYIIIENEGLGKLFHLQSLQYINDTATLHQYHIKTKTEYAQWSLFQEPDKALTTLSADAINYNSTLSTWNVVRNQHTYHKQIYFLKTYESTFDPLPNIEYQIDTFYRNKIKRRWKVDTVICAVEGMFLIKKNKLYGYCDSLNNMFVAPQYDTLGYISEGLIPLQFHKGWGFLNTREDLQIQPYYDVVSPFKNGKAIVKQKNQWFFINYQGKNINSITYDSIVATGYGNYYVYKNNKVGICGPDGVERISTKFVYLLDIGVPAILFSQTPGSYGLMDIQQHVYQKNFTDYYVEKNLQAIWLKQSPSY